MPYADEDVEMFAVVDRSGAALRTYRSLEDARASARRANDSGMDCSAAFLCGDCWVRDDGEVAARVPNAA